LNKCISVPKGRILLFENRATESICAVSNSFIDPIDNLEKILEFTINYVRKQICVEVQTTRYDMFEYTQYAKDDKSHYHGNVQYGGLDEIDSKTKAYFDNIYSAIEFVEKKYLCKVVFDSKPNTGVLNRI